MGTSFVPFRISGWVAGAPTRRGSLRGAGTRVSRVRSGPGTGCGWVLKRAAGAFDVAGPVHEDAGDDRRVGDDGHDAHRGGTAGAREGIDLVDAAQQLRPAVAGGPQRPVHRISDGDGLLDREAVSRRPSAGGTREAGSGHTGPARVPAVVARHHLSRIGDVGEEPGEELERVQGRGTGRGPVRYVGAIGEAVQGEGVAGAVARQAEREGTVSRGGRTAGARRGERPRSGRRHHRPASRARSPRRARR